MAEFTLVADVPNPQWRRDLIYGLDSPFEIRELGNTRLWENVNWVMVKIHIAE